MNDFSNKYDFIAIALILAALVALTALFGGCASIGTPSGGRRDETPPRFVRANPAPDSRNFNGHRITIDFDELVNVKDAMTGVVISPPGASIPRVSSQGRRVIVNFTDSLLPNTTYTIDFGNSIEDNNEGNQLENFSYTFSTGEQLDSLRIAGMVLSSDRLEPMQRKIVGVHRNTADSAFTHLRFDRVARTDDRGRFSIEGLAPGNYRLFAVDDADGNYRYSSPEEEVAFYDVLLSPSVTETETIDSIYNLKTEKLDTVVTRRRPMYLPNDILLRSFVTDRKQQYIASHTRVDSTRLDFKFGATQREMPRFSIVGAPDLTDWYIAERSRTNDTISLWISRPSIIKADTIRVAVAFEKLDSLNNYIAASDTLRFTTDRPRVPKKKEEKKKKQEATDSVKPPTVHLGMTILSRNPLEYADPIIFETATPLARLDTTAFHLEEKRDTLWLPYPSSPPVILDSLNPRRYAIRFPAAYGKELRLRIDTIAAEGIYGLHTAPQETTLKVREKGEYSALTVRISGGPNGVPAFVELLVSDDNVSRREIVKNGTAKFENLVPGKYYMRLYLDFNGNGRYDTGDYHILRQPEQVFYYPKQLNIKQNWEKEESWNIMDTPMDLQKPRALLKNKPTLRKGEKEQKDVEEEDDEFNPYSTGHGQSQGRGNNRNNNRGNNPFGHQNSRLNGL